MKTKVTERWVVTYDDGDEGVTAFGREKDAVKFFQEMDAKGWNPSAYYEKTKVKYRKIA
jgi:pentatricopeptide repeat protein